MILLVLNLPLVKVWAKLLTIPTWAVYAAVTVFAALGAFAAGGSVWDIVILVVYGAFGMLLRLADVPVAPAVVGLILGPLMEAQLRRAMTLSEGDPSVLISSPLAIRLWVVMLLLLVLPPLVGVGRRRRRTLRNASSDDAERGTTGWRSGTTTSEPTRIHMYTMMASPPAAPERTGHDHSHHP